MSTTQDIWTKEKLIIEAAQYRSRIAFQKGSSGAYQRARLMGVLDEICAHMSKPTPAKTYTKEEIAASAAKYQSRGEFCSANPRDYHRASREGWLDEVCAHMETTRPHVKWTKKAVAAEAAKYQTRSEFMQQSPVAYTVARHKKWLDEVCAHMGTKRNGINWTMEMLLAEAAKYQTRKAFRTESSGAYQFACKRGWLDEVCAHLAPSPPHNTKWTKEVVAAEAAKYTDYETFRRESPDAYRAAMRCDWGKEVCAHMGTKPKKNHWTKKRVLIEASHYRNRSSFRAGSSGAFYYAQRNGFLDEACAHMTSARWTMEMAAAEAAQYKTIEEFHANSAAAYRAAMRNDWMPEICAHMPLPGSRKKRHKQTPPPVDKTALALKTSPSKKGAWTMEEVALEAAKYHKRTLFRAGSPSAYGFAAYHGCLDEVCAHMQVPHGTWTNKEAVAKEAAKYDRKNDFRQHASGAYSSAQRNGWINEVCAHMRRNISKEDAATEAAKYQSRSAFKAGAYKYYNRARKAGWLDEICAHMSNPLAKWASKEEAAKEAAKYGSRNEFRQHASGAYDRARKAGWLDEICAHMKRPKRKTERKSKWNKERILAEAAKHQTRAEFLNKAPGAYRVAMRNKWIEEVCAHMDA